MSLTSYQTAPSRIFILLYFYRYVAHKNFVYPKPEVIQNRRLSKTEGYPKPSGNEGVPKQSFGSQNFVQNFVLQALQSKALYGGKTKFCKPKVAKLLAEGGKTPR